MQNWEKLGRIFDPDELWSLKFSYASVPFARKLTESLCRVYFSARDEAGRSCLCWIIVDLERLTVVDKCRAPAFEPSKPGFFDEDGVMGCDIVNRGDRLWLYYIGWNRSMVVPFRNAIGIATSNDGGYSFSRMFNGPVLDRGIHDPCFVASMCVLPDGDQFRMYYLSCINWERIADSYLHRYHIKQAVSSDGIEWHRSGMVAIDFAYSNEYAISVPRVLKTRTGWSMWYSYRGGPRGDTYRIGYAVSLDKATWHRRDLDVSLDVSPTGWDSDMICYPFVIRHRDYLLMLYNGNGYGRSGIGLARLCGGGVDE